MVGEANSVIYMAYIQLITAGKSTIHMLQKGFNPDGGSRNDYDFSL